MASNAAPILPPAPNLAADTNAAGLADIRDIRGPVEIGSLWWVWALVAAVAAGLLIWWLLKRKKAPVVVPKIIVPPHRRAKERLRGAEQIIGDPYKFCSLVSDVLRVYLEERFGLKAPEQTTEEFLANIRNTGTLDSQQQELMEDFLNRCDLVKFARAEPTEKELRELLNVAELIIEQTEPAEWPPKREEAAT